MKRATDEAAANWEAIADGWADMMRTTTGPGQTRTLVLDGPHLQLLGDVRGKRVLDAGCGEGRFARMLAERGAKVTAVDLSRRMIELAEAEEAKTALGIEYAEMNMTDLSAFANEQFDAAVAYLSLLDVEDCVAALAEIARVLKPGSRFVFSTVHPCFYPPDSSWEPRRPGTIPLLDKDKLYRRSIIISRRVRSAFGCGQRRLRRRSTTTGRLASTHTHAETRTSSSATFSSQCQMRKCSPSATICASMSEHPE